MSDLKTFLESSGVAHLEDIMLENGMTLDVLIHANDNELSTLTTRVVDKIKLRIGLDKISQNKQDLIAISTPASSPKYNIIPTASVLNTSSLSKEFLFKELLDDELDLILCEESSQERELHPTPFLTLIVTITLTDTLVQPELSICLT